ncbi:endonuclease domain-containing protein [Micromonospora sp. NPDC047548]|uniref:endonuclease domain-containing protein n=1 Tax=Micromonospora sp. NPDC047548 TaxID=3155624 RepID=UPI0033D93219
MSGRQAVAAGADQSEAAWRPATVAGGLVDLPEHRRDALLWHFAYERMYCGLDYDAVDELVREQSPVPCLSQAPGPEREKNITAALGSDGRYHLCHGPVPVCGSRPCRGNGSGVYRHQEEVRWWLSAAGYHISIPPGAAAVRQVRVVRWLVELVEVGIDPALVRGRQRCRERADWPGYQGPDTPLGRVRAALVAAAGPWCHACDCRVGTSIDHDHLTNQVRGLLCLPCNNQIEHCMHAAGCRFADYLNDPPARQLGLAYPHPDRIRHTTLDALRVAYLGFDPRHGQGRRRSRHEPFRVAEHPPTPPNPA